MTKPSFKALLEEILRVPPGELSENDSRESVENWSSLADVEILTVVSSEFGIDAELLEYETVGELLTQLEERQAFSA
jgi:acyl carrier protein